MGGGDVPHVPDHRVYDNWREFPELAQYEKRLQSLGLKDPWIRNYAHLCDPKYHLPYSGYGKTPFKYVWQRFFKETLLTGWKPGVAMAAGAIVITEAILYFKTGKTSWHKSDGHH